MKKIIMLLLTMCVLFVTTACGSKNKIEEEALDAFLKAMSSITEYKSANYEVKMDVKQQGMKAKMEIDGGFINDGPLQLSMVMSMAASGVSVDDFMQLYIKDETMYLSSMGQKQKQELDFSLFEDLNIGVDAETMMDKKALKDMLISATLDGDTIEMDFDVKKLNKTMKSLNNSEDDETGGLLASSGVPSYDEFSLEVKVNKKGLLTSFVMSMEGKQGDTPMEVKLTWNMKDVNKVNTLVFPEDLDTYTDASASLEGEWETSGDDDLLSDEDFGF